MAKNLMQTAKKPNWWPTNNYKNYAYLTSAQEKRPKMYSIAEVYVENANSSLKHSNVFKDSYANLKALCSRERMNEIAFLKKYTGIQVSEKDISRLITAMNEILNNRHIFENALNVINQMEMGNKKNEGQITELYSFLRFTLPAELEKVSDDFSYSKYLASFKDTNSMLQELAQRFEQKINELLDKKIESGFQENKGVAGDEDLYSSFLSKSDPSNELATLERNALVKDIMSAYGITLNQLKTSYKESKKKGRKKKVEDITTITSKKASTGQGVAFEAMIGRAINKELEALKGNDSVKMNVHQTGQMNNMKADQIITIGEVDITIEDVEKYFKEGKDTTKSKSVREQNRRGVENLLTNIKNGTACIVEVSDKSYDLRGSSFAKTGNLHGKGFAAESPNLNSLEETLSQTALASKVEDLIFLLANSGDDMINGKNYQDCLDAISLNIASFLFDDVNITRKMNDNISSTNVLHVFNLGGIIVPLSAFLEAALKACLNFSGHESIAAEFVDVKFHKGATPEYETTNDKAWTDFYNKKRSNVNVSIHFFGDFINYIKKYIDKTCAI